MTAAAKIADGPNHAARLAALLPRTVNGPDYCRGVVSALADHRQFASWGNVDFAEHYLLLAELRAGLFTWDEFQALDPFNAGRVVEGVY